MSHAFPIASRNVSHVGLSVYSADGLRLLLTTPMERFGGHSSMELIRDEHGDRVLSALASDDEELG